MFLGDRLVNTACALVFFFLVFFFFLILAEKPPLLLLLFCFYNFKHTLVCVLSSFCLLLMLLLSFSHEAPLCATVTVCVCAYT